ncbi:MAG: hypothetical protein HY399_03095 [Elusimicrobia bacterium]|nr:hypothetical protein [Elusimicrobiota bacterium]
MGTDKKNQPITFHYSFTFEDKTQATFEIRLDSQTLDMIPFSPAPLPEWTRLEYAACDHCPLKGEERCPVAVNLAEAVEVFKNIASVRRVTTEVRTLERRIAKEGSAQDGLSSLFGLCIAASRCPIMEKLKPMARFHLPFANVDETVYRVVSMYLTAQYFRMKKGLKADWDLQELKTLYEDIQKVNLGLSKRLLKAAEKDATLNALIRLDALAVYIHSPLFQKIKGLENLFASYLENGTSP